MDTNSGVRYCNKCKKIELPIGYKYNLCEGCRNRRVDNVKKVVKVALTALPATAIFIVTKGKKGPFGKA